MPVSYVGLAAITADGRIAPAGLSQRRWTSIEDWRWFQQELKRCAAVVVGRTTYRLHRARLRRRNAIVLTSRVQRVVKRGSVTFLNPARTSLATYVQAQGYRRVAIAGGARVYAYALAHRLMTELWLTVEPFMFLAGTSLTLWPRSQPVRLKLRAVTRLNKRGTLLLRYTPHYAR